MSKVNNSPNTFNFSQIATVRSPYREKFGIPRQPRLADDVTATIELCSEFDHPDTLAELEQFSHLWIIFVFHQCLEQGWKNKVRPPRLGGNKKIGVFASRSPFRPNPVGMSAVEILSIERAAGRVSITVKGADLVDGTPIIDLKPYVPYSDAINQASSELAADFSMLTQEICFSEQANQICTFFSKTQNVALKRQIEQILRCDPRPAYHRDSEKIYGLAIYQLNVRWKINADQITVIEISEQTHLGV